MAANLAALRAALVRMGTTAEVANEITATQGIDTIEELRILTDDEVETLCRAIRRPGRLMPNPAFNAAGGAAAAVAAGIPAQITHTRRGKPSTQFPRRQYQGLGITFGIDT